MPYKILKAVAVHSKLIVNKKLLAIFIMIFSGIPLILSPATIIQTGIVGEQISSSVISAAYASPMPSNYHYETYLTLCGSNYLQVSSSFSPKLTTFSLATWFRTSNDFAVNSYIVNKGGSGSENAGQNMNYGIWMTSSEKIEAGFETSSGTNHFVTSPASYSDGQWHYAVLRYGGSTVRLFIDGIQVATKTTSGATPDNTGNQPFRIGANSLALNGFFTGNIDEVRIWNRAIPTSEVEQAYDDGVFNTNGQLFYQGFNTDTPFPPPSSSKYHYEPSKAYGGFQFDDTPDSPALKLPSTFTLAAWVNTNNGHIDAGQIVNKGGIGSDQADQNLNYGVWFNSANRIQGGFETSTGQNVFVTSPNTYTDGQWHWVVLRYSGSSSTSALRLYVDNVQVASISTSGLTPESTNNKPLRLGANSFMTYPTNQFFDGSMDEVMVYNNILSTAAMTAYYDNGVALPSAGRVFYQSFESC